MNKQQELIFVNGKIFTSNPDQPYASAMKVNNGRIAWIGKQEEVTEAGSQIIDLQGCRVIPGLVDAHLHPWHLAMYSKQIAALPPNVYSIVDLQKEIRAVRETLEPGRWIECWGYAEGKLKKDACRHAGILMRRLQTCLLSLVVLVCTLLQ